MALLLLLFCFCTSTIPTLTDIYMNMKLVFLANIAKLLEAPQFPYHAGPKLPRIKAGLVGRQKHMTYLADVLRKVAILAALFQEP